MPSGRLRLAPVIRLSIVEFVQQLDGGLHRAKATF